MDGIDGFERLTADETKNELQRQTMTTETPATHCQRSACGLELKEFRWRIWNNPSAYPGYRDYCDDCGFRIMEANQDHVTAGRDKALMQHETIMPFSMVLLGATFRYARPSDAPWKADTRKLEWVKLSKEGDGLVALRCGIRGFLPCYGPRQPTFIATRNGNHDPIVHVIG